MDPVVGVLLTRRRPGAPSLAELQGPGLDAYLCDDHLPLSEALARQWSDDAHLVQYRLVDEDGAPLYARANKQAPLLAEMLRRGMGIRSSVVCLDHDLPDHREWRSPEEPLEWLAGMPEGAPSPTAWYTTLHGSRLVYVLSEDVDCRRAEAVAAEVLRRLEAARGMELGGARACLDWSRLFRLPRTVREDTGLPFWQDPRFVMVDGGPVLDVSAYPVDLPQPAPEGVPANLAGSDDPPDEAECAALLWTTGDNGHRVATEFAREARRRLRGRPVFAVAFEDARVDVSSGWDNGVMQLAGSACGMLADCEVASAEGVLALLRGGLEQLTAADESGGKDWVRIGWDKVRRVWAQEEGRLAAARRAREAAAEEGVRLRQDLAARVRAAVPDEVPADDQGAQEWLRSRMIASDGSRHYVMRRDGSYNLHACSDSMLVPLIRELGMDEAIPTTKLRGHGIVDRSAAEILNAHAVPVTAVSCSAAERVARVDGPRGSRVLRVPIHLPNPALQPARSADVEEWLEALFGEGAERGLDWLAHALEVRSPICALNLYGTPSSGKGMLVQGLAECFDGEAANDGRAMDRFNIGLLRSPVISCDEGVPRIRSLGANVDEVFRSLVSGGTIQIEGKMRDIISAHMYPRLVFTSNSRDITRELAGARDLSEDDVRAIEQRLLSIQVGPRARRLLESRGARRYTAGWIAGDGPSRYVVANHLAWLHMTRRPSTNTSGRFLVEGEVNTRLVADVRLRSAAAQTILRALARMLETGTARAGLHLADCRAWVTSSAVVEYAESCGIGMGQNLTLPQASQVLRQFSVDVLPAEEYVPVRKVPGGKKARWVELDLAMLLEECLRYGMQCDRIEAMVRTQEGGALAAAEARTAATAGAK